MTTEAIGVRHRHAGHPTPESWDEGRVVSAAVAGDRAAFEMIVRRHDDGLRVLAWHVLGDRDLMDDALQDAYVKAFVGLRRFRGEAALSTWLYRIVYTTCLTYLRRRRPHLSWDAELDLRSQASTDDLDDLVAHRCDIGTALESLPPELCATLLLTYREGFSYEETGQALGIPPGTVGSRLNHARKLLRQALSRGPGKEAP